MKLIIDTNILISALIKDSLTRKILLESGLNFYYPEESFKELEKYKSLILRKSEMSEEEYEETLFLLLEYIKVVNPIFINHHIGESIEIMGNIDPDDVIFIATALAYNAKIWSDDKHFQQQNKIKVLTTGEMTEMFN